MQRERVSIVQDPTRKGCNGSCEDCCVAISYESLCPQVVQGFQEPNRLLQASSAIDTNPPPTPPKHLQLQDFGWSRCECYRRGRTCLGPTSEIRAKLIFRRELSLNCRPGLQLSWRSMFARSGVSKSLKQCSR